VGQAGADGATPASSSPSGPVPTGMSTGSASIGSITSSPWPEVGREKPVTMPPVAQPVESRARARGRAVRVMVGSRVVPSP
jgi:hypothetical protein